MTEPVLEGEVDRRHILVVDGTPVAGDHDQVVDLVGIGEFAGDAQQVLALAEIDTAAGDIDVFPLDGGENLGEGEAVGGEAVGIELDPHLPFAGAGQDHVEHPGNLLDALLQLLGNPLEDGLPHIPGNGDHEDGELGEVDFEDRRVFLQIVGEIPLGLIDLVPHPLQGVVDIHVGMEFDGDHRRALGAHRADLLQLLEPLELTFDGEGDEGLDILRRHPLVIGYHQDIGNGDVRVGLPGQGQIAVDADDGGDEHQHIDGAPALDGGIGDEHLRAP